MSGAPRGPDAETIRANLATMRRGFAAFNQRDLEAWLELLDPEIVLEERYLTVDTGVYSGHDGVRQWLARGGEAVADISIAPVRWFARGDVVATEVSTRIRGAASGVDANARYGQGVRLRDGRIVYLASFETVEVALEAMGLTDGDEVFP